MQGGRKSVGVLALAVEFPGVVRTNDYYRKKFPEVYASAEQRGLAKLWGGGPKGGDRVGELFDEEMAPYLSDVFRGTVERRLLAPGETVLDVELRAARAALAAARLEPEAIDLLISATFIRDHVGIGHSAYVAGALGYTGSGWNFESACSSSLEALRVASGLVRAGEHERVLVVTSCMYSKVSDERDTQSWFLGDGAAAFVVGEVEEGFGVLGAHSLNTANTCGSIWYEISSDPATPPIVARTNKTAGKVFRESCTQFLEPCTDGALERAGVKRDDVDFFIFNTPNAWFAKFAARVLGVDPERTISSYPEVANVGPALMPANLHQAAREKRLKKGDLVLAYTLGSVASAGAVVMRWGDVALAPAPAPGTIRQ